ncbi:MAG: TldD/PmbA family protein [Thermoflexales bacterium]|nr:TldD/PmbA family protein [Thermoflexales bacterium]
MKELIDQALNAAQLKGATYADVRVVHTSEQAVATKNGVVEALGQEENHGFGVRVIADGAWGFASSSQLTLAEAERVAALAVSIARASALFKRQDVELGPPIVQRGSYRTPIEIDPFEIPLDRKIETLLRADAELHRAPKVKVARGEIAVLRQHKSFGSSEGSLIEQEIVETGCGIEATAVADGEIQVRSYPNSVGRHQVTRGYEFIEEMDLPGNAGRVGAEAEALLSADQCPAGEMTVIIGSAQLALQVHESCGHAIELDRVFGSEAAYAGTSFLTTDKLGTFRYGSPLVNMTAESLTPGGLGTFGWDDEGVPASSTPIVRDGIFVGYLMSRESAHQLGKTSNGCMRASNWNRVPIIRMVNVNLDPGEWTLDELIADTDEGLWLDTNRSWSIDDKRLNFQFGTEIAYEIKAGRLGRMLKNATYTGITPQFWGKCDAICNRDHWVVWGTPNCGKGQPSQIAHTGHGTAPARFRGVQVGVLK